MVKLEPIEQEEFESFIEPEIRGYAKEHVRNGNWTEEGSLEKSRQEFQTLLPNGIHTQDQYIWSIVDGENKIGVLWIQVKEKKSFIYDFVIYEAFRGKGYGKQALTAMDERLRSMNVESVALHVFGDNTTAQELYKKMGFEIGGLHMRKQLK